MNTTTRIWIVGGCVLAAGIVLIVIGALSSIAAVTTALSASGAGLVAGGLAAVLVTAPQHRATPRAHTSR